MPDAAQLFPGKLSTPPAAPRITKTPSDAGAISIAHGARAELGLLV